MTDVIAERILELEEHQLTKLLEQIKFEDIDAFMLIKEKLDDII
jgi:hypothetical protein